MLSALLAACGGSGGGGPPVVVNEITFDQPTRDTVVGPGSTVTIQVAVRSAASDWLVDVLADGDGDLGTPADQHTIASGLAGSSMPTDVTWDTTRVARGSYSILARASRNGEVLRATATGRIIINSPPVLVLDEPSANQQLSRGGLVAIAYRASDPDDDAIVHMFADVDGDISTTGDQTALGMPLPETDAGRQDVAIPTDGVPTGIPSRILGVIQDGVHLPATVTATATVEVSNRAWAHNVSLDREAAAWDLDVFPDGSTVVVGFFLNRATFGSVTKAVQLTARGDFDAFIARYEADGSLRWAKSAGSINADGFTSVHALPDGSCVVLGAFGETIDFSSTVSLTSRGAGDVLVARYDSGGRAVWARSAGGPDEEGFRGRMTGFSDGSVIVTGSFGASGIQFDAQTSLASLGGFDVFVARYSGAGDLAWAVRAGGTGDDEGHAICSYDDGSFVIAGPFSGTARFGNVDLIATPGSADLVVARGDTFGNFQWARSIASPAPIQVGGVACMPDSSTVIVGTFESSLSVAGASLDSRGSRDQFVLDLERTGELGWLRQIGGTDETNARGVCVRADGHVVVYGDFRGLIALGSTTLTSDAFSDVLLAAYDFTGQLQWARATSGPGPAIAGTDVGQGAIAGFADGSFAAVGGYAGSLTFGAGDERSTRLIGRGPLELTYFQARFNADGRF